MAPEVGFERGVLCCPNTYKSESSSHSKEIKLTPQLLNGCTGPTQTGTFTDSSTDTFLNTHPNLFVRPGRRNSIHMGLLFTLDGSFFHSEI